MISPASGWMSDNRRISSPVSWQHCPLSGADIGDPGTCLYLSHLTSQHSPLLTDPSKNKWVYGGNVLVDPVGFPQHRQVAASLTGADRRDRSHRRARSKCHHWSRCEDRPWCAFAALRHPFQRRCSRPRLDCQFHRWMEQQRRTMGKSHDCSLNIS